MIKVIVISDIKIYCDGLKQILSKTNSIEVVGAVKSMEDAIIEMERDLPNVILLDMTMADSSVMAHRLINVCPNAKVVALAVLEDDSNLIDYMEAGIAGYVARQASLDKLIETVIGTHKGEFYCPRKIATFIFQRIRNIKKYSNKSAFHDAKVSNVPSFGALTKREQQIVMLLVDGLSNKQISRALTIEVSTVKNHVHNILVKLGVKSRTQAVSLLQRSHYSNQSRSLDLGMSH